MNVVVAYDLPPFSKCARGFFAVGSHPIVGEFRVDQIDCYKVPLVTLHRLILGSKINGLTHSALIGLNFDPDNKFGVVARVTMMYPPADTLQVIRRVNAAH